MKIAARLSLAALLAWAAPALAAAAEPGGAALAARARQVLRTYCYRCHGQDGANEGGFNYVLDSRQLWRRKKVVPGQPARSRLFRRVVEDEMPPAGEKPRPAPDEIALLKQWIEQGAPDAEAPPPERTFLSPVDVVRFIRADLDRVRARDRRFTRYFTLTHLYNAGLSTDQIQSYRHGLSKLVNSLSWGPRVVVPVPVDPHATVFRIDLRDYQWNEAVWEAVLASNPYGLALGTAEDRSIAADTGCILPYVRGDWFVAAASHPPLYHEILQLPGTARELEKILRVDVAEDIRQERVARAGFNGSGVSRNNRLIERHESGAVVYWKSYDFLSNRGRSNLFAHPLGPGGENSFRHDGGEIIFSLPNGLQGYLLVDGRGQRIDKGPTSIVSDPRRPDRAVENGISCMSCHAQGILDKTDQVRGHVLKNARAFAESDVDTILALYPPPARFTELVRKDARRFQEAVVRTGAPLSVTEPVVALALRFEAEMDLALVAAEAGVRPAELLRALERSPSLAQHVGEVTVEGGTVQRQVFIDVFPDLVEELKVGSFVPPGRAAAGRLVRQGDDLLAGGDRAGALKAYTQAVERDGRNVAALIGRGDVYRLQGEYDRAIADYTRALDFDPRSAVAHNNRGLAYQRTGDQERALADFSRALEIDPRLAAAYHNRAAAHHARGEPDRAIADYTRALDLDPKSAVALNNRGFVHLERKDFDQAIADFSRALGIDPRFAIAYNNRGLAYLRQGAYDLAIADFSRALEINPRFARACYNRGSAYNKKGDSARAEADRAQALRLDPSLEDE